ADDPELEGVRPDLPGLETREIVKGYRFWLMLAAFALISFGVGGLLPNFVRLLISKNISAGEAASYASFIGLSVLFGRAFAGYLLDRIWAPIVAVLFLSVPAIGCFILLGETTSSTTGIIAAICLGLSAGAEFDLIAYMCTRYFGLKNYGFVYSLQYASFGFFSGITPAIFGRVFVQTGSYDPILTVSAALFLIGPLLLFGLGRYPDLSAPDA
ncbi:MAG: MFS transporter, partial [Pseudomonadota bacterium]